MRQVASGLALRLECYGTRKGFGGARKPPVFSASGRVLSSHIDESDEIGKLVRRGIADERGAMSDGVPARIEDQKFVSLTTFKRNGEPVAAPMWIVGDSEYLWAWTPADAWKVKRIRRDPRVTLTPCGRTGKVPPGRPVVDGTAEVITDPSEVARIESLVKRKYGLEFRLVTLIEAIAARGRKPRFALRITPSSSG